MIFALMYGTKADNAPLGLEGTGYANDLCANVRHEGQRMYLNMVHDLRMEFFTYS